MKVLIVVTSHSDLGQTGKKTGWYLPEVAHPYYVFKDAGLDIVFVSPRGGDAPMDPGSVSDDPVSQAFLKDDTAMALVKTSKSPAEINASDFRVIFYAGGHGPMFDLPSCDGIAKIATKIYENGGVVGAVCHGTVGLVPVTLSNGDSILKGATVTSFTNAEEKAVDLTEVMPFLLETRLKDMGANFVGAENFVSNVQVSGKIVTGQNPPSAKKTAEAIVKLI